MISHWEDWVSLLITTVETLSPYREECQVQLAALVFDSHNVG